MMRSRPADAAAAAQTMAGCRCAGSANFMLPLCSEPVSAASHSRKKVESTDMIEGDAFAADPSVSNAANAAFANVPAESVACERANFSVHPCWMQRNLQTWFCSMAWSPAAGCEDSCALCMQYCCMQLAVQMLSMRAGQITSSPVRRPHMHPVSYIQFGMNAISDAAAVCHAPVE